MELLPIQVDCVGLQDTEEALQGGAAAWNLVQRNIVSRASQIRTDTGYVLGRRRANASYTVGADLMSLGSRLLSHLPTLTGIPYVDTDLRSFMCADNRARG